MSVLKIQNNIYLAPANKIYNCEGYMKKFFLTILIGSILQNLQDEN